MDSGTKIPGVVSPATAVVLAVAASVALCVGCTERAGGGTGSGSYHCPEASPHRVGEGSGWLAVEADHFYTCALDAEGAPWCWGGAQSGRLGVGDVAADVPVPSRIEGVTGWVGLALADYFTCGWDGAGEISCWGGHIAGAVAYPPGTRAARPEPIAVREAAGTSGAADDGALAFASATIADGHTCALTPAGLAYCWAGPAADRLGVEDPPSAPELSRTVDLQHVGASSRFSDIDAGARHTCGLTTDGRVVCWGGNTWGQVGSDSAEE